MLKLRLTLAVDDDDDLDPADPTGLTSDAYDRLSEALFRAGFSLDEGPTPVEDTP